MWWEETTGETIQQGAYLPDCAVAIVGDGFPGDSESVPLAVGLADLIVLTNSCDIENAKKAFVLTATAHTVVALKQRENSRWTNNFLEEVKKQRHLSYCLLGPLDDTQPETALVVDFATLHSLPLSYLQEKAAGMAKRCHLRSPYVEHLSQAFARVFMRVALPIQPPSFKTKSS